jgi:Ser/Thr protein kinase RdoA (MazF antagonist)
MIQEITTEELKLLEIFYNQRDSQLVMIEEITTEELKLLEMFCNQRDSQLVMIREIITEAPKVVKSNKDKLEMLQLRVKEEIALEIES